MSKVTITNNPLVALRLGLPFRLCRLPDKGPQFGHGVYIPPGHLQRFMTMHAMSLIEDLEALAIRDEMIQEEVDRLRLSIDTRRATCGLSPRALVGHTEQSDIVGRVEVAL